MKSKKRPALNPVELARLLADMDDATAARLLRRSYFHRTWRRAISAASPATPYSPEEDGLVGTMTDARVGAMLGRSKNSVRKRRIRLGKPLLQPRRRNWSPAEDALLGKFADAEVARRLNRTYGSVQARRLGLGVDPRHNQFMPWTNPQKAWIGELSREEIARRTGRSLAAVKRQERLVRPDLFPPGRRNDSRNWKPDEVGLLGTLPDTTLAERLRRTHRSVANKRRKLRIPALPARSRRYQWTSAKDAMLRTHSDRRLMRLWHASARVLRERRRALGIPPTQRAKPWTAKDLNWLRRFNNKKVAQLTGRTLAAINEQRQLRGTPPSRALPGPPRRRRRAARSLQKLIC